MKALKYASISTKWKVLSKLKRNPKAYILIVYSVNNEEIIIHMINILAIE